MSCSYGCKSWTARKMDNKILADAETRPWERIENKCMKRLYVKALHDGKTFWITEAEHLESRNWSERL